MKTLKKWLTSACLLILTAGCSGSDSPYDADWGADDLLSGGKADGLIDIAAPLAFDQVARGIIEGDMVNVYTMQLTKNDEFKMVMSATEGDLNPHITVFLGTSVYLRSDNWNLENQVLSKWYTATETGKYLVAVMAYHGQGEGRYSLTATCLGGPCNGEYPDPVETMEISDLARCFQEARVCAFGKLDQQGGAVDESQADQIFADCLAATGTEDGESCANTCQVVIDHEYDIQPQALCDTITSALSRVSSQPVGCAAVLDNCLNVCHEMNDGDSYDELSYTPEGMCWMSGFNGNCDSFFRGHKECGGDEYESDTLKECFEFCFSTTGAWYDDLDDACDMDCEEYCQAIEEECNGTCESDPECVNLCLYETTDGYCY